MTTEQRQGQTVRKGGTQSLGTKVFPIEQHAAWNAMSAWPLIIKGKPSEKVGRKAMGPKCPPRSGFPQGVPLASSPMGEEPSVCGTMAARPLIIISKPPEMTGRKAMGAKVLTRYASPAAGYFASEHAQQRKEE